MFVLIESKKYCTMMMTWNLSTHHLWLWQRITCVLELAHVCRICCVLFVTLLHIFIMYDIAAFEKQSVFNSIILSLEMYAFLMCIYM